MLGRKGRKKLAIRSGMRCRPLATAAKPFIAPTPRKPTSSFRLLTNTSGRLCHSIRRKLRLKGESDGSRRQQGPSTRKHRRPMKQHPIETLDPVFRWLDWVIAEYGLYIYMVMVWLSPLLI